MNPHDLQLRDITRRHFCCRCVVDVGVRLALAVKCSWKTAELRPAIRRIDPMHPLAPRGPHFAPKAKRVIYLFMAGGPSQLELFDDKPKLRELQGQPPPPSLMEGKRFAFLKGNETLLGSQRKFAPYGQCGMTLSELFPYHRKIVDEVCWLRGMTTDVFNHAPAKLFMNTGFQAPGRPAMGAWTTYGLGSESRNLPGFVVLQSGPRGPRGGSTLWSSGFLPSPHQGGAVPRQKATPSSTCTALEGKRGRRNATFTIPSARSSARGSWKPATRKSRRVPISMRWHFACRRARPI